MIFGINNFIKKLLGNIKKNILILKANGQYKYLVRRWDSLNDIELAEKILATDFFKQEIKLLPIDLSKVKSYMVLSPHQDDETIGAGGTLFLSKKYKPKIEIVYIFFGVGICSCSDFAVPFVVSAYYLFVGLPCRSLFLFFCYSCFS